MEKIHPETGKILHRDVRLVEFSWKGEKFTVNMPGWYPDDDSDAIFTREDLKVSEAAIDAIELKNSEKIHENNLNFSNAAFA